MNKSTKTPDKTNSKKNQELFKPIVRLVYGDGYDPSWGVIHNWEVEK